MRYSLKSLMIVVMVVAVAGGCNDSKSKIIRKGIQDVDKHAKDIDKAGEAIKREEVSP